MASRSLRTNNQRSIAPHPTKDLVPSTSSQVRTLQARNLMQRKQSSGQVSSKSTTWRSHFLCERLQSFMESPTLPISSGLGIHQRDGSSSAPIDTLPTEEQNATQDHLPKRNKYSKDDEEDNIYQHLTPESHTRRLSFISNSTPTDRSVYGQNKTPVLSWRNSPQQSHLSMSSTQDETTLALEHRIMCLEADKVDLQAEKLKLDHELKTVQSQLEREQIEVSRQRDLRETDCKSYASKISSVERQRDFMLDQVKRLENELKNNLTTLSSTEKEYQERIDNLQKQLQDARQISDEQTSNILKLQQQHLDENHQLQRRILDLENELRTATASIERQLSKITKLEKKLSQATPEEKSSNITSEYTQELEKKLHDAEEQLNISNKYRSGAHARTVRRLQDEIQQLKLGKENSLLLKEKLVETERQRQKYAQELDSLRATTSDYDELKQFTNTWKSVCSRFGQFLFADEVSDKEVLQSLKGLQTELTLAHSNSKRLEAKNSSMQSQIDELTNEKQNLAYQHIETTKILGRMEAKTAALERQVKYLRIERDKAQEINTRMFAHMESFSKSAAEQKVSEIIDELQKHNKDVDNHVIDLQSKLEEKDNMITSLKERLDDQARISQNDVQHATSDANEVADCKILRLKSNPLVWAEAERANELEVLRRERDELKRQLANGATPSATTVDTSMEDRLNKLEQELEQEKIRMKRLREVYDDKAREFRTMCYELLGYQIDVVQASRYRLHSMYAESSDHHLLFEFSQDNELQLLETDFSRVLDEQNLVYLRRFGSVPAFLSAITLDLFSRATIAS